MPEALIFSFMKVLMRRQWGVYKILGVISFMNFGDKFEKRTKKSYFGGFILEEIPPLAVPFCLVGVEKKTQGILISSNYETCTKNFNFPSKEVDVYGLILSKFLTKSDQSF